MFINERGDIAWAGKGSTTGYKYRMFVNHSDITPAWLSGQLTIIPQGLSENGHVVWYTIDKDQKAHLVRDQVDLGAAVFGANPYTVYQDSCAISEAGDVMWIALDGTTQHSALYLNDRDVSTAILGVGSGAGAAPLGFDRFGNYVWTGSGPGTANVEEVFVNQFDLSADALRGMAYAQTRPLAVAKNGQVLWVAGMADGYTNLYLSTPVPEPSMLLLGLPVLAGLAWRRRVRHRL
jgi:hypothetical protein